MNRYYTGTARVCLANAVEDVKRELLSRQPQLKESDAHRHAIGIVIRGNPEIMEKYRQDEKSQYSLSINLL